MNMKKFVRLMLLPAALIMAGSVAFAAEQATDRLEPGTEPELGKWYLWEESTCAKQGVDRYYLTEDEIKTEGLADDDVGVYFKERPRDFLEHTWGDWKEVTPATCTTPGKEERTCSVCKTTESREIKAGHVFGYYPGEEPFDDCLGGTLYYKCGRCGATDPEYKGPEKMTVQGKHLWDRLPHVGADIEGTVAGNCVTKEVYREQCTRCKIYSELKTGEIRPDVHDYGAVQYVDKQSEPTCTLAGHGYRLCNLCKKARLDVEVPALGHIADMDHPVYVKKPTCTETGLANYPCAREYDPSKPLEMQVMAYEEEPKVVEKIPHQWTEWLKRNDPVPGTAAEGGTLGYWIRKCKVCGVEDFLMGMIDGLAYDAADGKYKYYDENGEVDTDYVGMVAYGGGLFIVNKGEVDTSVNGVGLPGDTFYFFANGQVQTGKAGFAEYDGEWFVLTNEGTLNIKYNGLYEYDGGLFWVAAGQKTHYTGLQKTDRGWLYMEDGQVMEQTGLKAHDGKIFYIIDGALAEDYTGTVKDFKGTEFNVVNGMVVK